MSAAVVELYVGARVWFELGSTYWRTLGTHDIHTTEAAYD